MLLLTHVVNGQWLLGNVMRIGEEKESDRQCGHKLSCPTHGWWGSRLNKPLNPTPHSSTPFNSALLQQLQSTTGLNCKQS